MTYEEQIVVIRAKARGEKIERQRLSSPDWPWAVMPDSEAFNFADFIYRIAAPAPVKRRAECWNTGHSLIWVPRPSSFFPLVEFKRVPALDKEWGE